MTTYRDVVLRLGAEVNPESRAALQAFKRDSEKAYEGIGEAAEKAGKKAEGSMPGLDSAKLRKTTQERVAAESGAQKAITAETDRASKLRAEIDEAERKDKLDRLNRFNQMEAKAMKAHQDKLASIQEKVAALPAGPTVKRAEAEKVAAKQTADAWAATGAKLDEIFIKKEQERRRQRMVSNRAQLMDIEKAEAKIESSQAKYEGLQEQLRGAKREQMTAVAEIGSSVMMVARGITALGLTGEESMEKIVKGLMKVQGAFDIISGGIQTWVKIQQAIEGTRRTIIATAAAEEALAAASAARGAIQGVSGAGGAAAGAASSGLVRSAAGGAAGYAGAAALSKTGLAGRLFSSAAGAAKTGLKGAGALLGPTLIAGLGADLFAGGGRYTRGGFGERMGAGGLDPVTLGRLANVHRSLGGGKGVFLDDQPFIDAAASADAVERAELATGRRTDIMARRVAQANTVLPLLQAGFAHRRAGDDAALSADLNRIDAGGRGLADFEKKARITEEILKVERQISEVADARANTLGVHEQQIAAFKAEQVALEQRQRDLAMQRATIDADAAQARLTASERELQNVNATIDRQEAERRAREESRLSGMERFGLMDPAQQGSLLKLFDRAQQGETLNPDELRQLRGIGSMSTNQIVRDQAVARAEAAGADRLFTQEKDAITKLEGDIARNVEIQTDVTWNVEFDRAALAKHRDELVEMMKAGFGESMQEETRVVAEALQGQFGTINTRLDGIELALRNGGGRG